MRIGIGIGLGFSGASPNQPPICEAGENFTIGLASGGQLDGEGTDPEEQPLTFLWEVLESSAGTLTIDDETDPESAISGDTAGATYLLQLTASDGVNEHVDTVTVTVNTPPEISGDNIDLGAELSGAFAFSASDGTAPFTWLIEQLAGSEVVTIDDETDPESTFTLADYADDIEIRATVTDAYGDTDTHTITVEATAPAPGVGPSTAQTATIGDYVPGYKITATGAEGFTAGSGELASQWLVEISTMHTNHKLQVPALMSVTADEIAGYILTPIPAGATAKLHYTKGADPLLDGNGLEVDSFTDLAITNTSDFPALVDFWWIRHQGCVTQAAGRVTSVKWLNSGQEWTEQLNSGPHYDATGFLGTYPAIYGETNGSGIAAPALKGALPAAVAALWNTSSARLLLTVFDATEADITQDGVMFAWRNAAGDVGSSMRIEPLSDGGTLQFASNATGLASVFNTGTAEIEAGPQAATFARNGVSGISAHVDGAALTLDSSSNSRLPNDLVDGSICAGTSGVTGTDIRIAFQATAAKNGFSADEWGALLSWLQSPYGLEIP